MKKVVSITLAIMMMLLTAAMVFGSEDSAAKETMEKNLSATEKVTEEVKEKVASTEANETTKPGEKAAPGFESLFAITGLMAVAYLIVGKRD